MKLLVEKKIEIPNQTCESCGNVYEIVLKDLKIGLFGMDDMSFVCWTCPRCKTDNRPNALQVYMNQVETKK